MAYSGHIYNCGEGYPIERSLRSCSVLEVIGSHCPQYFRLVILWGEKKKRNSRQYISIKTYTLCTKTLSNTTGMCVFETITKSMVEVWGRSATCRQVSTILVHYEHKNLYTYYTHITLHVLHMGFFHTDHHQCCFRSPRQLKIMRSHYWTGTLYLACVITLKQAFGGDIQTAGKERRPS